MDLAEIGLKADSSQIKAADKALNDFSAAAGKAEKAADGLGKENEELAQSTGKSQGAMAKFKESINGMLSPLGLLKTALGGIVAGIGISAIAGMADTWSDVSSRVGVAIGDMDAAEGVMGKLTNTARLTYSSLSQTAEGFVRNSTVLQALGKSTQDQIKYTEALNLAMVASGTKGQAALSVQEALSKGMTQGKLATEQLQTVLNNSSEVTKALAAELNTSVLGLQSMATQGRITGEVIFNALTKRLTEFTDKAASMPATIGDGFLLLGNAITALIGKFDQMNGISETIATGIINISDGILWLSDNFDILGRVLLSVTPLLLGVFGPMMVSSAMTLATVIGGYLVASFNSLIGAINVLKVAMMGHPILALATILSTVIVTLYQFREELGLTTGKWAEFWELGVGAWNAIKNAAIAFWGAVGPLLTALWDLVLVVYESIGVRLVAAFQLLWVVAEPIIDFMIQGLQGIVDLINYISGADIGGTAGNAISNAATNAATQIAQGHITGGAQAASNIAASMTSAGAAAGNSMKAGISAGAAASANAAKATWESLNGKVIQPLGKTLTSGGEFIYNQVTGAVEKAGPQIGSDMQKGGATAGEEIKGSMVAGGQAAAKAIYQTVESAYATLGFIHDVIKDAQLNMRAEREKMGAEAAKLRAEAEKFQAEAAHIRRWGTGGGGGGGSGGSGKSYSSSEPAGPGVLGNHYLPGQNRNWMSPDVFATGGEFTVGGNGGVDSTPVSFMATPGERVKIEHQSKQEQPPVINLNIKNVTDPEATLSSLSTARGQQEIINVLANNRDTLAAILGVS